MGQVQNQSLTHSILLERPKATNALPSQPTPFIGRTRELAEVRELLADPACRLLTLVGPGGIGKTRLAVDAATRLHGFADGVYFVALQPIQTLELLVPAIADAAGIILSGQDPLSTQLLNNLRNKHLLLLLDNFEHLLTGASLLVDILHMAPNVKLLDTSREVIGPARTPTI